MKYILVVLLMVTAQAHAKDLWLDVHMVSKHSSNTYTREGVVREYNEINLGLGLTKELSHRWSARVGVYKNSYYKTSVYLGYAARHTIYKMKGVKVDAELFLGAVSGYTRNSSTGIIPMGLPALSVSHGRVKAIVGYIPAFGGTDSVATLSLGFKL